jgi:Tfp pilus assembly protein PilN
MVDRRIVWAAAITLLVLLLGALALHEQHVDQAELDNFNAKLKDEQQSIDSATAYVGKVEYARRWLGGTPRYIACLRDLTNVMPDDGKTYLTGLDLKDDMEGALSGKTMGNDDPVRAAASRMTASKNFNNVTTAFSARETREGKEVTFTISFKYVGHD